MKTDNEIIAEFYNGITFYESGQCTDPEQKYSWRPGCFDPLRVEHLRYDKSWDWLMEACKKFCNLQGQPMPIYMVHVRNIYAWIERFDIQETHITLAQAIKWFNSNHPNQ